MSKEKDLSTVKKTIRALLLSAKSGLTTLELRNDYEGVIGHPIPIYDLGFSSLIDLLKSMPDAVAMHTSRGSLILSGVSDASCRHVASMVARQKSSKPYNAIKPGMNIPSRHTKLLLLPPIKPKEVPTNVKLKLNQLMISYSNGLPLSKFQEAFNRRFGYYVQASSWGFGNLLQALCTLDTITLERSVKGDGDYMIYSNHSTG